LIFRFACLSKLSSCLESIIIRKTHTNTTPGRSSKPENNIYERRKVELKTFTAARLFACLLPCSPIQFYNCFCQFLRRKKGRQRKVEESYESASSMANGKRKENLTDCLVAG